MHTLEYETFFVGVEVEEKRIFEGPYGIEVKTMMCERKKLSSGVKINTSPSLKEEETNCEINPLRVFSLLE